MQTSFFPACAAVGLVPLDDAAMNSIYGGDGGDLVLDIGAFLISPAFGFFYLGFKAGYANAAAAASRH